MTGRFGRFDMRGVRWGLTVLVLGSGLASACGGSSSDGLASDGEGGVAGAGAGGGVRGDAGPAPDAAAGGASGSGAAGGSSSGGAPAGGAGGLGSGGVAGVGGVGGTGGGSAGSPGVDAGPTPCAPPTDPTGAALCLSFAPEAMTFGQTPDVDGRGILVVEIFDTPDPESDAGPDVPAIAGELYPNQPAGDAGVSEVSVDALPTFRFEGLPDTVYIRAIFVDNLLALSSQSLLWGTWIGGANIADGIDGMDQLQPVSLPAGQGTNVHLEMTALRRLRVTATLANGTTPLDDGQGPLGFVAFDTRTPGAGDRVFGLGGSLCRDVTGPTPTGVTGFVIGAGPHYVIAGLDDFALDQDDAPGEILTLDVSTTPPSIPQVNEVMMAPDQYAATLPVVLSYVRPLDADAGAPASFSCSMLFDAGTD